MKNCEIFTQIVRKIFFTQQIPDDCVPIIYLYMFKVTCRSIGPGAYSLPVTIRPQKIPYTAKYKQMTSPVLFSF